MPDCSGDKSINYKAAQMTELSEQNQIAAGPHPRFILLQAAFAGLIYAIAATPFNVCFLCTRMLPFSVLGYRKSRLRMLRSFSGNITN